MLRRGAVAGSAGDLAATVLGDPVGFEESQDILRPSGLERAGVAWVKLATEAEEMASYGVLSGQSSSFYAAVDDSCSAFQGAGV
jgi:hypothetical protein